MKYFILIIIASILLFSCRKKTTVVGKVINPVTGLGIEGATVVLQQAGKGLPAGLEDVESVISDVNGDFNISAKKVKPLTCAVALDSYQYYHLGWSADDNSNFTLSLKKGKTTNANYYVVPYGKLQININNQNCQGPNDTLKIFRTHSLPNFYDNVPNPAIYVGCINQIGNFNDALMGQYTYSGEIIRSGVSTPVSGSIYLNEGETKTWNINY